MVEHYDSPSQMEPMLIRENPELTDLALEVIREAGALSAKIHSITKLSIANLVRHMNSYYSNLIEGHHTVPQQIEKALRQDFSSDPKQKALQCESKAHIEVEELVDKRIATEPDLNICSAEFLCWMHTEFYKRMPEEFLTVHGDNGAEMRVIPGQLRCTQVTVGHHVPPIHTSIPEFLRRFSEAYDPRKLNQLDRIIAAGASHHRLAWIHPFLDGNGRVTRLFTHAYLGYTKVDGHGLWTITRGMARHKKDYMDSLALADSHRLNDLDGRGNLSQKALLDFCIFFLKTALDQIQFMGGLLEIGQLQSNIGRYVERRRFRPEVAYLLGDLVFRGELPRGDVAKFLKLSPSQARIHLGELIDAGIVVSDTQKGPIKLGFPLDAVFEYFPKLYPTEVELEMDRQASLFIDEAKAFIKAFGLTNGPLNGRMGGPGTEVLKDNLEKFFGRQITETDDLYRALVAVREIAQYSGLNVYRRGDPEPPASEVITKDQFLQRFQQATGCKPEYLPLIRYALDLTRESPIAIWRHAGRR